MWFVTDEGLEELGWPKRPPRERDKYDDMGAPRLLWLRMRSAVRLVWVYHTDRHLPVFRRNAWYALRAWVWKGLCLPFMRKEARAEIVEHLRESARVTFG